MSPNGHKPAEALHFSRCPSGARLRAISRHGVPNFRLVRHPGVAPTDCSARLLLRKFFLEFTGELVNVRCFTK
jgi:hypothetical protein